MKKIVIILILCSLVLACVSCSHGNDHGHVSTTSGIVTLSPDEKTLIETIDDITNKVSVEEFTSVIEDINHDPSAYIGQIYMMQGFFTTKYYSDGTPFLYQIKNIEGHDIQIGIPLEGLDKAIKEGSQVRVLGIFNKDTVNNETVIKLDIVTIESVLE